MDKEILEELANLEHERWSRWQKYLHSQCKRNNNGSLTIPADKVKHWERQIKTPYKDLSDKEKDSDRKEARKTLNLLTKKNKLVKESLL
ncbi:MAG: hypothetical protein ACOC1K_07145 [Nanoarchaeota archaeon]